MGKVLDRLHNQARFIQMIVDRKLSVSARKKADIVVDLKSHGFTPFPKKTKASSNADEAEGEEEEEEEAAGSTSDFDYLLNMPIYSLTKEKVSWSFFGIDFWTILTSTR